MINQRFLGRPYRYAYSTTAKPGWFLFNGFVKHDLATGESWKIDLPEGRYASEAPFAPRVGSTDEDDGYLVSFIIDENRGTSECVIIDCKRFADGPVCRIALPHKISSGTHAHFVERAHLEQARAARRERLLAAA
jgi:carotenoid cleavage dioxygenase